MPTIGDFFTYGTPVGWASLGLNKIAGTPTYGDVVDDAKDSLSGKKGLATAAEGARQAQEQANALAQLQWQRQMQGLQEARGQTQPYLSLYDKIYGTQMAGHVAPVGGLGGSGGGMPGPDPYSGRGARPDGTTGPTTPFAHPGVNSQPAFAPITRGGPPAPGSQQPPPVSTPSQVVGAAVTSQANDALSQYLRSLGAIR